MAHAVKPSIRGELEITTLNAMYLEQNKLNVQLLGRGFVWLDTGTIDSLIDASTFVQMVEKRQNIKISVLEEIAFQNGWIDDVGLQRAIDRYGKSPYGEYLKKVFKGEIQDIRTKM